MVPGVLAIEQAGLLAWPALETAHDGAWVLRASNGYTKRANSLQCLNPADDADAAERLERAAAWFAARRLPPIVRVTPLCGTGLLGALSAGGWGAFDHSHVMARSLEGQRFSAPPGLELLAPTDRNWLAAQQGLQGYTDETRDKLAALVGAFVRPARGVVLRDSKGRAVSSCVISVASGIAVLNNVVTDTARRGRGLATEMLTGALAWALGEGATAAAHAVVAGNEAALRLYDRLGYTHQYDYHYCRAP